MEYMERRATCEICMDCFDDVDDFAADIRIFSNLEKGEILTICEAKLHTTLGECRSRCDPEEIDSRDCYKEPYCNCTLTETGARTNALYAEADSCFLGERQPPFEGISDEEVEKREDVNRMRDIICPRASILDPADVRRTCQKFDKARTAFSEEIERDGRALCRGFCPLSGSCEPGFNEVAGLTAQSWSDGRDTQGMRLDIWHGPAPPPDWESGFLPTAEWLAEPSLYSEKNHYQLPGVPQEREIQDLWVTDDLHFSLKATEFCLTG